MSQSYRSHSGKHLPNSHTTRTTHPRAQTGAKGAPSHPYDALASMANTGLTWAFTCSGGGTRTHNLLINSRSDPLRLVPLHPGIPSFQELHCHRSLNTHGVNRLRPSRSFAVWFAPTDPRTTRSPRADRGLGTRAEMPTMPTRARRSAGRGGISLGRTGRPRVDPQPTTNAGCGIFAYRLQTIRRGRRTRSGTTPFAASQSRPPWAMTSRKDRTGSACQLNGDRVGIS
jgi:hypothetical protein